MKLLGELLDQQPSLAQRWIEMRAQVSWWLYRQRGYREPPNLAEGENKGRSGASGTTGRQERGFAQPAACSNHGHIQAMTKTSQMCREVPTPCRLSCALLFWVVVPLVSAAT